MEITLEKIELVKDRTGVTYAEAKQALEENDGSVVDAIIDIEETVNAGRKERSFGDRGRQLFDKLKDLVKKGNVARIKVKRDDDTILNVPVNAGILGIAIAPLASVVAVVAAFGFKCVIEVVKQDGTIIDVSDAVTETVGNVTEKGSEAAERVKDKASILYEKGKGKADEYADKVKDKEFYEKARDKAEDLKDRAEDLADDLKDKAGDWTAKAGDIADDLKDKAEDFTAKAGDIADDLKERVEGLRDKADDAAEEVKEEAAEAAEAAEAVAEEGLKTRVRDLFGFQRIKEGVYNGADIDTFPWPMAMMEDLVNWIQNDEAGAPYRDLNWDQEFEEARTGKRAHNRHWTNTQMRKLDELDQY